jgi:hypothetical protein
VPFVKVLKRVTEVLDEMYTLDKKAKETTLDSSQKERADKLGLEYLK